MKDPAFLFYASDFITGIQDLTMEERGQYITLLCIEHQKGRLSKKLIQLSVGNVTADVLSKFKVDENGLYYNERLEVEMEKRREHSDKQRVRALDGWKKRKEKPEEVMHSLEIGDVVLHEGKKHEVVGVSNTDSQNLLEAYFKDFPNSSHAENIARILKVDKAELIKALPEFRKSAALSYPNGVKFAEHFKNWYLKVKNTNKTASRPKKLGE